MIVVYRNWLNLGVCWICLGMMTGCGDKNAPPSANKPAEKEKEKANPEPPPKADPFLDQVRKGGTHWSSLPVLDLGEEIGNSKPTTWEMGKDLWIIPEEDRVYTFKQGAKDEGAAGDIRCKWRTQNSGPLTKETSKPKVRCCFVAPEKSWFSRKEKEGYAKTEVSMELPVGMSEGTLELPLYFSTRPLTEDVFVQIVVGDHGASNILRLKVKVEK